jgi:hypothetical protein
MVIIFFIIGKEFDYGSRFIGDKWEQVTDCDEDNLKLQRLFNTTNAKVLVIDRLCTHY